MSLFTPEYFLACTTTSDLWTHKKSGVFHRFFFKNTDVRRGSWENIVNIETPVRRTAVKMVALV